MKSEIFLPIGHVYKSEVDLGSGPRCSPWGAIWVDDAGWELDQRVSEDRLRQLRFLFDLMI